MVIDLSRLKNVPWSEVRLVLPDILVVYEAAIDQAEKHLSIRGKTGAEALKEQTAYPAYYGQMKAEINKLLKYIDAQTQACRGRLHKQYAENYSRALSERAADKYIDNEAEYLGFHEVYLEVEEIRDKLVAICDAFSLRGFTLRDWTQLKIAQMQDDVI